MVSCYQWWRNNQYIFDGKNTVHGRVFSDTDETAGFLALPHDQLGSEYLVDCYTPSRGNAAKLFNSAIHNWTHVSIMGTNLCTLGNTGPTVKSLYLDAQESVSLKTCNDSTSLTGTYIISNESVSVIVGSSGVKISGGGPGFIIEQLLPISAWGHVFIVPPFHGVTNGWRVRVMAICNTTTVNFKGCNTSAPNISRILDSASFYTFGAEDESLLCIIQANQPVQVVQYMSSSTSGEPGDPSMVIVPAVRNFHSNTSFGVTVEGTHMDIISSVGGKEYIRLDGETLDTAGGQWKCQDLNEDLTNIYGNSDLTNTTEYCYFHQTLSIGEHTVTHTNNSGRFSVRLYHFTNSYGSAMLADVNVIQGNV